MEQYWNDGLNYIMLTQWSEFKNLQARPPIKWAPLTHFPKCQSDFKQNCAQLNIGTISWSSFPCPFKWYDWFCHVWHSFENIRMKPLIVVGRKQHPEIKWITPPEMTKKPIQEILWFFSWEPFCFRSVAPLERCNLAVPNWWL